ncbi:Endospore coat-associated protein YheD [compost metagenome]
MSQLTGDQKPVVAVLTVPDEHLQFRGNRANFRDIVRIGREMDFPVYVVTTKDLNLSASRIKGYLYSSEDKEWKRQWVPLPQVIYNRIPLREDECKKSVQRKISECMKHSNIHLFNPYFFNKWRLFDWLKKNRSTRSLVPNTKRLRAPSSLSSMLVQYKKLYLKPESGKAGKGIMLLQLESSEPAVYQLTIQGERKKNVVYRTTKLPQLWKRIRAETGRVPYIMQEGIELCKYHNRHFDLRLLVQKTGKGVWTVTGVGARLAGHKRITTHVPQGGSVEDPEQMLIPAFGSEMTSLLINRLKSNALLIARQIEKGSGYVLGEMSMDLGIDTEGSMWFFEANAKPMKFDEPHIRKKSLERIFQFSHYLSRQSKN